jgi:DNA polymerase-4
MIIHLDLDCFFVSAERTIDASLVGKPVAVVNKGDTAIFSNEPKEVCISTDGGAFAPNLLYDKFNGVSRDWKKHFMDTDGKIRGIVVAKSYEAKQFGIKTGTPLGEALKLCPQLIVLPQNYHFYHVISHELRLFLETKIPVLEQYSIDEFFGNLSGWIKDEDTYDFIKELQNEILDRFKLPISIGAAKSKWTAKLATSASKPYGVKVVWPNDVGRFVSDIPIDEFPGVGRALGARLKKYGISTLGEVLGAKHLLYGWGTIGKELYHKIEGTDNEPVNPYRERRSIGISRNFQPIQNRSEIWRRAMILARHLAHTIAKLGVNPTTYFFKLRYDYGESFKMSTTHDRLFNERFYVDLTLEMLKRLDVYTQTKVVYIALSASNFTNARLKSFDLLNIEKDRKMASLLRSETKLRDKYGIDIVRMAGELI